MTRTELHDYFPAVHRLIAEASDAHPLWVALRSITVADALARKTLLPTLERVAEAIGRMDGHRSFQERVLGAKTHAELMNILSQLYVAYLYRDHGPRLVHGNDHFHIEISIADQLLALGVVQLHSLDSIELQFREEIENVEVFMDQLKSHAHGMQKHATAHHHVIAAVSKEPSLTTELALRRYVAEHRTEMIDAFPHVSGVVLVHALPDKEEATFIPFHTDHSDTEWMLTKES